MPTSPLRQNTTITGSFRRIRDIFQRADEGIGPYGWVFLQSDYNLLLVSFLSELLKRHLQKTEPSPEREMAP